jgi:hypothetical protein
VKTYLCAFYLNPFPNQKQFNGILKVTINSLTFSVN